MPLSRTDDDDFVAFPPRDEADPAALVRVLGGVVQEVGEHLREPHRVRRRPAAARRAGRCRAGAGATRSAGCTVSTALATTSPISIGARRSTILPRVIRDTSSRSSTSRTRWWTCRSIMSTTCAASRRRRGPTAAGSRARWRSAPAGCGARARASRGTRPCGGRPRAARRRRARVPAGTGASGAGALARAARSARRSPAPRRGVGRSSSVTLPRLCSAWTATGESAPCRVITSTGRSDHGGWRTISSASMLPWPSPSDSSVSTTAPAPAWISRTSVGTSATVSVAIPASARTVLASVASLPVGASTSTRMRRRSSPSPAGFGHVPSFGISVLPDAFEHGDAGQHAPELAQRLADADVPVVEAELADRALVRAAALLHDRDRLADLAARLEVAQQDHRVGEVARVDRRVSSALPIEPHVRARPGWSRRPAGRGRSGARAAGP